MSKGLEALKCLERVELTLKVYRFLDEGSFLIDNLNTIKQALQRLEQIDNAITICKKANKQKFVYIKESYGIVKEKFLDDLDYEVLSNRLYVNSREMYYDFPLKDYGVWWALTKEELEND